MGIISKITKMAKAKKPKISKKEKALLKAGVFKGYDIRWLREVGEEHPDFGLVAEYDKLMESLK